MIENGDDLEAQVSKGKEKSAANGSPLKSDREVAEKSTYNVMSAKKNRPIADRKGTGNDTMHGPFAGCRWELKFPVKVSHDRVVRLVVQRHRPLVIHPLIIHTTTCVVVEKASELKKNKRLPVEPASAPAKPRAVTPPTRPSVANSLARPSEASSLARSEAGAATAGSGLRMGRTSRNTYG